MVHRDADGTFFVTVLDRQLPGRYATDDAAQLALLMKPSMLVGLTGVITRAQLEALLENPDAEEHLERP